jgi:nitroreductase
MQAVGLGGLTSVSAVDDLLASVLEAARLAPSTYNTQPWRFAWLRSAELLRNLPGAAAGDSAALLLLEDTGRRIPQADPAAAETLLSLGACLANIVLAAEAAGWSARVVLADGHPDLVAVLRRVSALRPAARPVAVVRFDADGGPRPPDAGPSPLRVYLEGELLEPTQGASLLAERAIFERRRSERAPYTPRPLPRPVLERGVSAARQIVVSLPHEPLALFVTADPERLARARRLLRRSIRRALSIPAIVNEAAAWFPPSREHALERGEGEPLDAAGWSGVELWLARRALQPRLGPILMRLGGAERVARRYSKNVTASAVLLCWATLPETASPWEGEGGRELSFLSAGCAIEAFWLSLTADGAGLQFMTACTVSPESRKELADIIGLPTGYTPLSVQRAGYPNPPSAERPIRRPLAELIDVA